MKMGNLLILQSQQSIYSTRNKLMQLINGTNWSTQFVRFTVLHITYVVLLLADILQCWLVCYLHYDSIYFTVLQLFFSLWWYLYTNIIAIDSS